MEAGESIDSAARPGSAAASAHSDASQGHQGAAHASPDKPAGDATTLPDLTIMDGIPSLDASNLASFLPAASAQDKSHQDGPSLEEQIQAFTAGIAGQLGDVHTQPLDTPVDTSALNTSYNTPTQGQGTPATAEDIASFETLIASLMPTPQSGSPISAQQAEPSTDAASHPTVAGDHTAFATPEPQPNTSPDDAAQSFVDTLLRQANLFSADAAAAAQQPSTSITTEQAAPPSVSQEPRSGAVADDALNASLEQFMASLQARVTSSLATEATKEAAKDTEDAPTTPKPKSPQKTPKPVKKPKKVLGKRKYREIGPMERRTRVEKALAEYIASIDTLTKPNTVTGPIPAADPSKTKMTTVRCAHASVAQKSYGSEKRFFNPPPIISVTGPLRRYAEHGAATLTTSSTSEDADEEEQCRVSLLVRGDTDEFFSNENVAVLDQTLEAKMRSLYVTPTGRSKSFRLQLNLLRPSGLEPHLPIFSPLKKSRAADPLSPAMSAGSPAYDQADNGSETLSRLPKGLAWASFESAPVTIISKSSKKTAKPRGQINQVQNGSLVSLFNRINSQTARTKYMNTSSDGALVVHNGEWSTYRITLISRPPLADLAGAEEDSVTYGSTIVLTDVNTGASSDPLVVCKVDKGQVQLPQLDPPAELPTAGSGNKSRRVPIDRALRDKLAAASKMSSKAGSSAQPPSNGRPAESKAAETPGSSAQSAIKIEGDNSQAGPPPAAQTANGVSDKQNPDDLNLYGPVGQLQKVALMRFVPSSESETVFGDSEHLESNFATPRSYLCATMPEGWKHLCAPDQVGKRPLGVTFARTHEEGFGLDESPQSVEDVHKTSESNSIAYITPSTASIPKEHASGNKEVDEVDDGFVWTVIGVSRFEYSYFDTSATQASKDEGPCEVPMTPFPLITSMPTYDQTKHTLITTVTNFIVPAAITSEPIPLDVWVGSIGPLKVQHSVKRPASTAPAGDPEAFITVTLPPIRDMLKVALKGNSATAQASVPAHFLLPLIFVNDSDGTAYHSGRHIVCEDLVQLMKATGHDTTADVLKQLGFGLGDLAGPPVQGAWSLRII
ncbi:uncharacterized protein PAN0_004c2412 [Moesziomyces antarcticus]|uniref:Uncharacterized protein n=2 Tax=Pseudozyma antarctica TaxID=84753 RepID=A0A081CC06_PSEA2|nr:uncharacterized protein PAN0_004c2412 [Moesziomyces antarcticus]GAK64202.1 conserved hypothetical protein [Moesziomyces antarcticus]SPO44574.1 uncharacterized protein PSANT_02259 [Moesziomyces antarcticus]